MQKTSAGDRFGLWTILQLPERGSRLATCLCDCGTEKAVNLDNVRTGKSQSCGCRRPEYAKRAGETRRRHSLYPGQKWGRLTVTEIADREHVTVLCRCGTAKTVTAGNLFNGSTRSCGCLAEENRKYGPKNKTHGMKGHPLYKTWNDMMRRCYSPERWDFKHYGGRGIRVCERWHDVRLFIMDIEGSIGPRPARMSIDRYPDNDGNYEPGNIRWATPRQQANNRRKHRAAMRPAA